MVVKMHVFCQETTVLLIVFFCLTDLCMSIDPLYTDKDDVVSLRKENYDRTVLAKGNAWLMEFYNSWCGHCQRFVPVYQQLATDIKDWGEFIKLGAVDCAQEYNTELCKYYNIHVYPTLKFYPAFSTKEEINGTDCRGEESAEKLRHNILNFLSNSSLSRINGQRHSILEPLVNLKDKSIDSNLMKSRKVAVIFEFQNSYLGREVILDVYRHKGLFVRRVIAKNSVENRISNQPSLYLVESLDGNLQKLATGNDRAVYVSTLLKLIESDKPVWSINSSSTNLKPPVQDINDKAGIKVEVQPEYDVMSNNYLKVYEQDLESSLHYSLRHELAIYPTFSGETLSALKLYINVLSKYLPVRQSTTSFLLNIHHWLERQDGQITGSDWLESIQSLQTSKAFLPESTKWIGCSGSESKYRGYPCSLWMTFHSLTIAAYDAAYQDYVVEDESAVKEVLIAVRGYVQYFFGCRECSKNFMRNAVHIEDAIISDRDGVLYLWRSHNRANRELAGDVTEDPTHPKFQFPTFRQCPSCHAMHEEGPKNDWNEDEVLWFLQKMYGWKNVVPDPSRPLTTDADKEDYDLKQFWKLHEKLKVKIPGLDRPKREGDDYEKSKAGFDVEDIPKRLRLKSVSKSGMGKIDVGMCILFYLFCIFFIVLVYFRFTKFRALRKLTNCRLPV